MFAIAAPSMMLTCTLVLGEFPCEGTRSDLCQFSACPCDGGHAWFSCSKNSSIFPSRICDATYSLEKREQSFFRDESCCWDWSMSTIIDGAAVVNMLRPGAARKFSDYANQVFIPYILSQHVNRVDVVWDDYHKAETRSKRGKGVRRRVEPCNAIPRNWQEFLRIDDNKTKLFSYLAICVSALDTGKQVFSTHQADILCSQL